jgi:DNA-binding XRE family transcriptional regulator
MKPKAVKRVRKISRPGGRRGRPPADIERKFLQRLGEKIKSLRVDRKLTAAELAAMVGVSAPTHFHREAGRVSMPVEELSRYATALGVKVSELLPD